MSYVLSSKAVRTLRELVRGSSNATTATYSPATINYDTYRPPFSVQWSADQNNGSGAWEIWLPDLYKVLFYGGDYIAPTGISAAVNEPEGWYTIDDVEQTDEEIWLVLSSDGGAKLTNEPSEEYEDVNLLIATMEIESSTDIKWVKQYVDSAIFFGGSGGRETPGCFRIINGPIDPPETSSSTEEEEEELPPTIHFGNRYLQFGNLTLTCDDVEITDADYPTPEPGQDPELVVAIKATTTSYQSEPTISIVTYDSISEMQEDQHKLDYVIIPLYLLGENFSVQCDFRKQPMAPVGEVM